MALRARSPFPLTRGMTVSNITFNAAGSGSYNITGAPLILTGTPTITVASGVTATNSSPLGGTGFAKAGNGTFVLLPSVAATNVGATIVNAGSLFLASTAVNSLNDNVVVNPGADPSNCLQRGHQSASYTHDQWRSGDQFGS